SQNVSVSIQSSRKPARDSRGLRWLRGQTCLGTQAEDWRKLPDLTPPRRPPVVLSRTDDPGGDPDAARSEPGPPGRGQRRMVVGGAYRGAAAQRGCCAENPTEAAPGLPP